MGIHFATGGSNGDITFWNREAGEHEHTFKQGECVHAVAYDHNGKRLAVGSSDHRVLIYDTANRQILSTLSGHTGAVLSVCFSRDGKLLVQNDGAARLRSDQDKPDPLVRDECLDQARIGRGEPLQTQLLSNLGEVDVAEIPRAGNDHLGSGGVLAVPSLPWQLD